MESIKSLVKRSIGFTAPQMDWLKKTANSLEISIADLVRRIIDTARKDEK